MKTKRPVKIISGMIISALFIFTTNISAQTFTDPGTVELGGGIAFSSQTTDYEMSSATSAYTVFALQPYLGIMIPHGIELGFLPGITAAWNHSSTTIVNLFFIPSLNINTKTNVYPFVEFPVGYNSAGSATNKSGMGYGINGGVKVNISGHSLLLVSIQYLHQNFDSKNAVPSTFDTSLKLKTFSFGVGFRVFVPRKTETKK